MAEPFRAAIVWIRDGVLIDRMHINPVAFAVAAERFIAEENKRLTSIEALIQFGFETSGLSCKEKMMLFNSERAPLIRAIQAASAFYAEIATKMDEHCGFSTGILRLLEGIIDCGHLNFITSAVDQKSLDQWRDGPQGSLAAPYLTEILGARANFEKGRDHFSYIAEQFHPKRIYYIADAPAEISAGAALSHEFPIRPVAYAHFIPFEAVQDSFQTIQRFFPGGVKQDRLDKRKLRLPSAEELSSTLKNAGAAAVVRHPIADALRDYFEAESLFR